MAKASKSKKVYVIGGGFGGLNAARALGSVPGIDVFLIDRRNHHLFQPLLYQVAMADLNPSEIAVPIRSRLKEHDNVHVLLGNVHAVDVKQRLLTADFGSFHYDYLILACGAKHSYFGNDHWEEYAPGLKTIEQATEIRRRVLLSFELAEREKNTELKNQLQTIVVVGGGPTGVELAGAVAEICRHTLPRDFDNIDPSRSRIILIESNARILGAFDEVLALRATRDLERLGVHVWTSRRVTDINERGVALGDEFLRAGTVIWAAGVEPSSLNRTLGVPLDRQGRVVVGASLALEGYPEVFVIGDQAHAEGRPGKGPLPGLASVAIQQGRYAGAAIVALEAGRPVKPFRYVDKGQMATIGRNKAIAQVGDMRFGGVVAWLAWLFVHLYYLIGFQNKVWVFLQWAKSYFSYKRTVRLILSKEWRQHVLRELPGILERPVSSAKDTGPHSGSG